MTDWFYKLVCLDKNNHFCTDNYEDYFDVFSVYLSRQNKPEWKSLKIYRHLDDKEVLLHFFTLEKGEVVNVHKEFEQFDYES